MKIFQNPLGKLWTNPKKYITIYLIGSLFSNTLHFFKGYSRGLILLRFSFIMAEPFLAEIRLFSFAFAPKGWALCNAQVLPISQNQALFSLLGTTFGGNGTTTFALPDNRGRVPIHAGGGYVHGQSVGEVGHTLTSQEMPMHTHSLTGSSTAGDQKLPNGNLLAVNSPANTYAIPDSNAGTLNPAAVGSVGGSQPHENRQPFLTLSFCIALQGIFPSRN